jgi:sulfatase modifying factor 1
MRSWRNFGLLSCCVFASLSGNCCSAAETITNSIGMKLVMIPPGEFMMGAVEDFAATVKRFPYARESWLEGEFPRHRVRITRPFYLGVYEVTLGQFLTFYHAAKYKLDSERDGRENWGYDARNKLVKSRSFSAWSPGWQQTYNHPVVYVTWNDATAFCDWLSQKEGRTYRLPTEAEWEYACRAGTTSLYYNGNDPEKLTQVANVADATAHEHWPNVHLVTITAKEKKKNLKIPFPFLSTRDGYAYTAPVGSFRPNPFGIYDAHGNVWEWCSDYYSRDYYSQSPAEDPTGPEQGKEHVLRGGGWYNVAVRVRSSDRSSAAPDRRFYMWGFRVIAEPPPIELEVDGLHSTLP